MPPATSLCHVTIDLYRPQTTTFRSAWHIKFLLSRVSSQCMLSYLYTFTKDVLWAAAIQRILSFASPFAFHILSGLYSDKWGVMILQCGILRWVKLNDGRSSWAWFVFVVWGVEGVATLQNCHSGQPSQITSVARSRIAPWHEWWMHTFIKDIINPHTRMHNINYNTACACCWYDVSVCLNAMHDLGCASGSGMYNECNSFVIKCDTLAAAFACIALIVRHLRKPCV